MTRRGVEQPPEQGRYARVLAAASRAGLLVLVLSFAAYAGGWVDAHVSPEQLPALWGQPAERFIALTDSPRGWAWLRHLDQADMVGLAGIALLAGAPLLGLLALLPLYGARRDRAYLLITLAAAAVILLAASGWLNRSP